MPNDAAAVTQPTRQSLQLFRHSTRVLDTFKAVLHSYEVAEARMLTNASNMPGGDWSRDVDDITQVLNYARQYGLQLAETAIITPQSVMKPDLDSVKLSEAESLAIELFEESHRGLAVETWGQVAHRQVRALARACAILPKVPGSSISADRDKVIRRVH